MSKLESLFTSRIDRFKWKAITLDRNVPYGSERENGNDGDEFVLRIFCK